MMEMSLSRKMLEMAVISLSAAVISFVIGIL